MRKKRRNWLDLFRSKKPIEIELKVFKDLSEKQPKKTVSNANKKSELKKEPAKKIMLDISRDPSLNENNIVNPAKSKHEKLIAEWLHVPDNKWLISQPVYNDPTTLIKRALYVIIDYKAGKITPSKNQLNQVCYRMICFYRIPKKQWPKKLTLLDKSQDTEKVFFYYCRYLVNHISKLIELPREIYILAEKRPPVNAKSINQFYPWLMYPLKMKRRRITQTLRLEKHDGPRYTTFDNEELVKDLLIAHADPTVRFAVEEDTDRLRFEPNMTANQSKTTKRLQYFLTELIKNERLPELIEAYQRYRHDPNPKAQSVFKKIDSIIRSPKLFLFWAELLEQKNGLSAFPAMPKMNRHRIKNQPENQPDGRHPFDIIAGFYYFKKAIVQEVIIISYNQARTCFYKATYYKKQSYLVNFLERIDTGCKYYDPKIKPDSDAKATLEMLIESFRKITTWNKQSIKKAKIIWSKIHNIMQSVKSRQIQDIKFGKEFKDFGTWVIEYLQDSHLFYRYHEIYINKLIQTEAKIFIEQSEKRVLDILNMHIHHYPAYVLATETYLQIGRIYFYITLGLLLCLSEESKLKIFKQNACRYDKKQTLTKQENEYKASIDVYRSYASQCFKKALIMAGTAKMLDLSGKYEAIANNINATGSLSILFCEGDTNCERLNCTTLEEYINKIEVEIKNKWDRLYKVRYSNQPKPLSPTIKGLIQKISNKHNTLFNKQVVTRERTENSSRSNSNMPVDFNC